MKQFTKISGFFMPPRPRLAWVLSLALMVACAAPPAPAQEKEEPPPKSEKQIEAEKILAKAAKAQGGEKIAKNLKSFTAEFNTEYFNKEEGRVYYEVKRCFQFPMRLWTAKKHEIQEKPTIEVFDGEDGWLISPEGELTVYTDKPSTYKTDMENLEHDVRLTKQMFRYFFIANLTGEINNLERLEDKPVFEKGEKMHVVSGKTMAWLDGSEERVVYLKVFVDTKTHFVRAVDMIDLNGGARRRFVFTKYMKNSQGIQVPGNIKMYTNYEPEPEMTISIWCERGEDGKMVPKITFNTRIDPELFVIPEEDE